MARPSRRQLAAAASLLAVIGVGSLVAAHVRARRPPPAPLGRGLFDAEREEEEAEHSRSGSRWRDRHQWLHGGDPGPDAFIQYARYRARGPARAPPSRNAAALSPPWWQLGPLDFGSLYGPYEDLDKGAGRILSIAPHPTDPRTLFIASAGGLFVTHDAGTAGTWAWSRSDHGIPPAAGVVAISDADPSTIFYGLNSFARGGLFVSHDGGGTWSDTGTGPLQITALLVSGSLVVAGEGYAMYVSQDGGATFTNTQTFSGWITAVVQVSPQVLVAAIGGVPYRSTDGGATWSPVPRPDPVQWFGLIANSPAQPNRLYATCELNGIPVSDDGGLTWSFVPANITTPLTDWPSPTSLAWAPLLAVDPTDPARVFAGTLNLFRSVDAGASWAQVSSWVGDGLPYLHADMHAAAFSRAAPGLLYIGHDGGLSFTTAPYQPIPVISGTYPRLPRIYDSSQNTGRGDLMLYAVGSTGARAPASAKGMAGFGAQDHGTMIRTAPNPDQLALSQTARSVGTGDGTDVLVHPVDPNLWLISGYDGVIFKSTDGAQGFLSASEGITTASPNFFTDLTQGATPDTVLHTEASELYVSTNFGDSWTSAPLNGVSFSPLYNAIRIAAPSARGTQALALLMWQAPWGYITADQVNYTAFGPIPNLQNGVPSTLAFSPEDDGTLYMGSSSYTPVADHLWKSVDHGASWTTLGADPGSGFPTGVSVQVLRIPTYLPSLVIAGTDVGAFQSCDRGATWAPLGTGLPEIEVTDLFVAPEADFARVTTFGMGAWELRADANAPAVTVQPATADVNPGSAVRFQWNGGASGCHGWSLPTNNSGGSISPDGVYVAGPKTGTDIVQAFEAFGRSATAAVTVRGGVFISPPAAQTYAGDTVTFTASGGTGTGLTWSFINNLSRGTLSDSGAYTAGPIYGVIDRIKVVDSENHSATASVAVTAPPKQGCGCGSGSGTAALGGLWALAVLAARPSRRRSAL